MKATYEEIVAARTKYGRDGEIEVDDSADASRSSGAEPGQGGAWIQAWVWLDESEGGLPEEKVNG